MAPVKTHTEAIGRPLKLSAGIVIVRRAGEQWLFLLLRCFKHWDFPKGEVESGEDPFRTALRETREEAGLCDLEFRWGEPFYETPPYSRGKVARYYVAATETTSVQLGVNPELGRPEHHEFRWVTPEEGHHLLNDRLRRALSWAACIIIPESELGPRIR